MNEPRVSEASGSERDLGRLTMRMPDKVAVMLELKRRGWGVKKIAAEFGACPKTARGWIKAGGWRRYKRPGRRKKLDGLSDWLEAKMMQHRGNADVVRQDLKEELAIEATFRTVERAVAPFRRRLEAERRATVRFETAPGLQMQIDFGETRVELAGVKERVHLFVATLGYSRRSFVQAFCASAKARGLKALKMPFVISTVCRRRFCSTTRALWSTITIRRHGRLASTPASTPSPAIGGLRPRRARPIARAPKAKTKMAWAM
jgi:hypothetical protein